MKQPNGEDILALLIELLAEQEGIAIEIEVAA